MSENMNISLISILDHETCERLCQCKTALPRTPEYYQMMPWYMRVSTTACVGMYLIIIVLFIMQSRAVHRYVSDVHRASILSRIVAIFPVCGGCAVIAIIVPATNNIMRLIIPMYLTETLHQFVALVDSLYGGREEMAKASQAAGVPVDPKIGFFKCCRCIPTIKATVPVLNIICYTVYQAAITDFVLTLVSFINTANGVQEIVEAYPVFRVIKVLSTMSGNWACAVLGALTHSVIKMKYRLPQMFRAMQLLLVTINIQEAIFGILVSFDVFPEHEMLDDELIGSIYNLNLLILELTLLSIVSTHYFRPANCALFDLYHNHNQIKPSIEMELEGSVKPDPSFTDRRSSSDESESKLN